MVARDDAARPEQIREHNLGLLLRLLHRQGELTRSELVEATGLNRSTIAALVSELADQGIVTQNRKTPTTSGAGRPSYTVVASRRAVYGLAVDIDVRSVRVAAFGLGGDQISQRSWKHQDRSARPTEVVQQLVRAAASIAQEISGARCIGVGVGVPGVVRAADGLVLNAPNLGWRSVPFGVLLANAFDVPVRCGNDGDLAALAEHQRGVATGHDDLVCVIGRVGVGSGIVSAGLPLRGSRGYAGEIGHLCIDPQGPPCHCGRRGCLEQYLGTQAILDAAAAEGLHVLALPQLFQAATQRNPAALRALDGAARHLARGLCDLMNLLDPQMVVLTGHLADVLTHSGDIVRDGISHAAVADTTRPVKLTRGLLAEPTLVGAAELAFTSLLSGEIVTRGIPAQELPS
ncbi:ROK family transcriptional regulator [Dermatophilaceae bacterium Sec6.4]